MVCNKEYLWSCAATLCALLLPQGAACHARVSYRCFDRATQRMLVAGDVELAVIWCLMDAASRLASFDTGSNCPAFGNWRQHRGAIVTKAWCSLRLMWLFPLRVSWRLSRNDRLRERLFVVNSFSLGLHTKGFGSWA